MNRCFFAPYEIFCGRLFWFECRMDGSGLGVLGLGIELGFEGIVSMWESRYFQFFFLKKMVIGIDENFQPG